MSAGIRISLVEGENVPNRGNTWITWVPIEDANPRAIRRAVYEAVDGFLRSLAGDLWREDDSSPA